MQWTLARAEEKCHVQISSLLLGVSLSMGHGPVDSCGQVRDLDPSLVKTRDLSQVGQVRPVDSCGQVRVKMTGLLGNGVGDGRRQVTTVAHARTPYYTLTTRSREGGGQQ